MLHRRNKVAQGRLRRAPLNVVGKVRGEYIRHTRQLERCRRFCSRSDRLPSVQNSCSSSFKGLLAVDRGCAVVRWVLSLRMTRPTLLLPGATLDNPQAHITWLPNARFTVCRRASL